MSLCLLLLPVVFVAATGAVPQPLGLHVWQLKRWHFFRHCAGVLTRVALASLQASHCHCCRRCTGIIFHILLASLPLLRWHCSLCCTCITASIANWHLPNLNAVATHLCMWRCCRGHLPHPWPHCHTWCRSRVTWPFDGPANAALASLLVLCWHPRPHCAGVIVSIVL